MQIIDTRGQLCPAPLITTKRAIQESPDGGQFTVITDNDTACGNLLSFLSEMGLKPTCTRQGAESHIVFSTDGSVVETPDVNEFCDMPSSGNHVVVLKSETMGSGSDELGAMLIRACINSLAEVEPLPRTVIMYNGGVMLAVKGRDTADAIDKLASMGVKIIVCGACVDYFGIKTKLVASAEISNMYKINSILASASSVVYP